MPPSIFQHILASAWHGADGRKGAFVQGKMGPCLSIETRAPNLILTSAWYLA